MTKTSRQAQRPPLPTTKAQPRGEPWAWVPKFSSYLCSDCWSWVQSSCTHCWDTWRGLKSSSKRRAAASNLSSQQNSTRSEEHTSELQSHLNLVCRLLLEKKKLLRPGPYDSTAQLSTPHL